MRRTASLFAVAAEVFEERIVLSDTALLPPPDPADFGLNLNDPISVSTSNPGYAPFMAAQLAYTNQFITSTEVTTGSASVLDSYANSFNDTLGSGWSNLVGGAIYTVLPVSDATLASASDATLITGTTIVSIPLGIAIFAGGEIVLGVGSFAAPLVPPPVVATAAIDAFFAGGGVVEIPIIMTLPAAAVAPEAALLATTISFSLGDTVPVIILLP